MTWKERYASKLISPEQAAKLVRPGDRVRFSMNGPAQTPWRTAAALARRAEELHGIKMDITFSFASELGLLAPGTEKSWETYSAFAMGPTEIGKLSALEEQVNFAAVHPHYIGTLSWAPHREEWTARWAESDVCFITVTPPDKNGMVTFANNLWNSRVMCKGGKVLVGEVVEGLPIVPGGDNYYPADAFTHFVEGEKRELSLGQLIAPSAEETAALEVICTYVADLIDNGDTVFFGGGTVPMAMGPFLEDKEDLGIHTEVVAPLEQVRKGIFTGKKRNLQPGKISCTAAGGLDPKESAFIDGNPIFDIRDMGLNNNPRYLCQNDNLVAINAPLEITLFGEIGIERVGRRYFRGVGGQVESVMGALLSRNGRSIHGVVSKRQDAKKQVHSSIVPQFDYPGVASIPRQLADFVVTEYGVARLMGKTERERASELIEIAHPDYRPWLREEARKLFGVGKRYFT